MSKRIQNYNEDTQLHGEVIVKKKTNGVVTGASIGSNTLTTANKMRIAYMAGRYLNDCKVSPLGKGMICGLDGPTSEGLAADVDKQRCVVLLNLTNKTYTDKYIPIFNEDGSLKLGDTVIGWFNCCTNGGSNPYLGINTTNNLKQSLRLKGSASEVRGFFDLNKAIGTITHAAVMAGFGDPVTLKPVFGGFSDWLNFAKVNTNSFIIPPNITGLTGVDEILVYNPVEDINVYRVNLSTGDISDTSFGLGLFADYFTSVPAAGTFRRIDDNRLAYRLGTRLMILQYSETGSCEIKLNIAVSNPQHEGFFDISTEAGYLYYTQNASNSDTVYYKISLSNYSYTKITADNMTLIGGLPATWTDTNTNVAILGNNSGNYYLGNRSTGEVIICTDLSDVMGSIVGTMTYPGSGFSLFDISSQSGMMSVYKPYRYQDIMLDSFNTKTDLVNPTVKSSVAALNTNYLPWISYGYYSNYYNIYKLSNIVEKTDADTLDVDYAITYSN